MRRRISVYRFRGCTSNTAWAILVQSSHSATMWPRVVIIFRFIRKIIMNVLSEVWNCSPYGLREKNTWLWFFALSHVKSMGTFFGNMNWIIKNYCFTLKKIRFIRFTVLVQSSCEKSFVHLTRKSQEEIDFYCFSYKTAIWIELLKINVSL